MPNSLRGWQGLCIWKYNKVQTWTSKTTKPHGLSLDYNLHYNIKVFTADKGLWCPDTKEVIGLLNIQITFTWTCGGHVAGWHMAGVGMWCGNSTIVFDPSLAQCLHRNSPPIQPCTEGLMSFLVVDKWRGTRTENLGLVNLAEGRLGGGELSRQHVMLLSV